MILLSLKLTKETCAVKLTYQNTDLTLNMDILLHDTKSKVFYFSNKQILELFQI